MIIGTDGFKNVEWNISQKHSVNNFALILGISGMGKTTLNRNIIQGASIDGIPTVILDYSNSYRREELCFPADKLTYYNVAKEGLGLNILKRRICFVDNIPEYEDNESLSYRVSDMLLNVLRISGANQRMILQKTILEEVQENGDAASFSRIYSELGGTLLGEKLQYLVNERSFGKLNWSTLLKDGNIIVIQLSDLNYRRSMIFTELILNDLWNETKKKTLGDYLLCLDEIEHLNFRDDSVMQSILREGRKYSVAMLMTTQFLGERLSKQGREAVEQAAQCFYFRQNEKNITAVAKYIDEAKRPRWKEILRNLRQGEFVFTGNGIIDSMAHDIQCVLKTQNITNFKNDF